MIISLLTSCNSSIDNPGLVINENESVPDGWTLRENDGFILKKKEVGTTFKPFLVSDQPSQIILNQQINLDSGDYFVLAKFDAHVKQGSFFIRAQNYRSVSVESEETTCLQAILSIPVKTSDKVNIEVGFSPNSIGQALVDTIKVVKIDYEFNHSEETQREKVILDKELDLHIRFDSTLDSQINRIASSINQALLGQKRSHTLIKNLLSTYASDTFNTEATSYLSNFMRNQNDLSAYCQKSSLSLDELLRLYDIPTRQLHWQKNCSGIHQFLEYWNPYDKKWKIIDPYYGVRYINKRGEFMGFEEIESLIRKGKFTKDNIKQVNIGRLYYDEKEILDGWYDTNLAVYVINK